MSDATGPTTPSGPPPGPPPSPPAGPPPGPGPDPRGAGTGGGADRQRKQLILGVIAVVAVLALVGLVVALSGGDDDEKVSTGQTTTSAAEAAGGEVFLEPTASAGIDPFSESVAADLPATTVPLGDAVPLGSTGVSAPALGQPTSGGTASYAGGTPGLYGGTRNQRACDQGQLKSFLAKNPDKAQAWADVQGITVDQVPAFIDSLTPVLLRSDTRVTNYGFKNGRATPHQSVLQAGTAVLVDRYGDPQARCACGNPLNAPQPLEVTPSYQGAPWPGWNPAGVTVIVKNTTVIQIITLIDVTTGTPFGRPTGPNPGPDVGLPTPTVPPSGTTPNTFPPDPAPPGSFPQDTSPPATSPPATSPPTQPGSSGPFRLVDSSYTVSELKDSWSVDPAAGTARITISAGVGDYSWTVPATLDPSGTSITWGGSSDGNINIRISPGGTGVAFGRSDLDVDVTGTSGEKSTTVTVAGSEDEVTLTYSMGFSVNVTYTYRR